MASATFHNIVIQAASALGDVTRLEAIAAEIITPGELLELAAAGTVQLHAAAGGTMEHGKIFALETQTPDDEDNFSIDVDYAAADTVYYVQAKPGDEIYAWLAAGENATIDEMLESDGAGALQVIVVAAGTLASAQVGSPVVAVNNAGGGAPVRIRVRVI